MVNSVKIDGTVQESNNESKYPTVRAIHNKGGDVIGYSCRLRYETGNSIGWIGLTHWSKTSALAAAAGGTRIQVEGKLDFDSWETSDGAKRSTPKLTAENIAIPSEISAAA